MITKYKLTEPVIQHIPHQTSYTRIDNEIRNSPIRRRGRLRKRWKHFVYANGVVVYRMIHRSGVSVMCLTSSTGLPIGGICGHLTIRCFRKGTLIDKMYEAVDTSTTISRLLKTSVRIRSPDRYAAKARRSIEDVHLVCLPVFWLAKRPTLVVN